MLRLASDTGPRDDFRITPLDASVVGLVISLVGLTAMVVGPVVKLSAIVDCGGGLEMNGVTGC